MDGWRDLLLPRTDAGVWAQLVLLIVLLGGAILALRRHPDARLLVIGLGVALLGLTGLRAAH